jgi:hypothetical protein
MKASVKQSVEWVAGVTEVLGEIFAGAALSTTNPTRPDLGSNPGRRRWKAATSRLSYGTAWASFGFLVNAETEGRTDILYFGNLVPGQ